MNQRIILVGKVGPAFGAAIRVSSKAGVWPRQLALEAEQLAAIGFTPRAAMQEFMRTVERAHHRRDS